MNARWAVLLLLMTSVLAGCADTADEPLDQVEETIDDGLPHASGMIPVAPDVAEFLGTIVDSHVIDRVDLPSAPAVPDTFGFFHQLEHLHEGSYNLALADHNPLTDGLIGPSSGFIETDIVGDIALVSSIMGSRGATLVDISDPQNMEVLSHIYNLDDNWDARISEDGKYVFLGCQGSGAFDCTGIDQSGETPAVTGGGPCASVASCPGGIAVLDITDPRNPSFVDYLEMGFTHNVFTYMRDDKHYFMSASGRIGEWDPASGSVQMAAVAGFGGHDMHVQKHPLTGEWLMYSQAAAGEFDGDGMGIWNVTDPFNPVPIARLKSGPNATDPPSWHEQTPMPCLIDGRHYTIGAGESGAGTAGRVGIVDTTDPRNPVTVGEWRLPDWETLAGQGMYRYSVHNIEGNCDGQIAIGHYHAGVWVFDISTPERVKEPATLGYYLPNQRPVHPSILPVAGAPIGAVVTGDIPNVWSASWSEDGKHLFVPDMITGLYSLSPQWDFENMADDHQH